MVRKVGKWKGSKYTRYNRPRDPTSGIQLHDRRLNRESFHFYGAKVRRGGKLVRDPGELKKLPSRLKKTRR